MSTNISRRNFLKSTALGALGVAAANMLPAQEAKAEEAKQQAAATFAPKGDDYTYGAFLNPQDESGTACTKPLTKLFSPLKIGGVTLKNRIVKSAAGSEMQDNAVWPSDAALAYYGEFCKGGVGMVCYESSSVIPTPAMGADMTGAIPGMPDAGAGMPDAGAGVPGMAAGGPPVEMFSLDLSTDEGIPAHKALADYMHALDTPIIAQMYDMMMAAGGSSTAMHAYDMETSFATGKMQTTEEVQTEIRQFIDAAERYYKAGFDGIELNCSCNHYFSTYLSRFANNERTDQYSGESLENRARIVTEIISGIRERVGKDFIVQILYSGVEENVAQLGQSQQCTSVEEACEFAKLFEKAGASSLHIRSQAYGHHCGGFMPDVLHVPEHGHTGYGTVMDFGKHFAPVLGQYDGSAALIEVAGRIKSCVSIPVGAVGAMDPRLNPDLIEQAIEDGKIDFILMTRPLMADPQYCNKLREGRRDEIAPCTHCMTCFVAPYEMGTPMYCRVNASLTRAFTEDMPEGYAPQKAETPLRVLVAGGGPAGMEAARIAAQCGHEVTLCEKDEALGMTMDALAALKGPHEKIADHKAYLIGELTRQGVKVQTGTPVTAELCKQMKPDAVILATGGELAAMDVPGFERAIPAMDLIKNPDGEHFVILGAQMEACEAAIQLVKRGKTVTLISEESADTFYRGGATWPKLMGKSWLQAKGAKLLFGAKIQKIGAKDVTLVNSLGLTVTVPADVVVNALKKQPSRALATEIETVCPKAISVGDCYSGGTIANAVARANIAARNIGKENASAALTGKQVYTEKASGIGEVTVSIRVENQKIVEALVDTSAETVGIGRELGEQFAQQIVAKGDIDAVSGATITCDAVRKALESCKAQAGL